MPRPPRAAGFRVPAPPTFRAPGPLRLAPARSTQSVDLDDSTAVPYLRWDRFLERVRFRQGEHITIVGTTGSGKTVLLRELVTLRSFVVLLGTKNRDPELYQPFEDRGFRIVAPDEFDPSPEQDESRVIFRPRRQSPDDAGLKRQAAAFRTMLNEAWEYGGWTIAADELWYLTSELKLDDIFRTLWSQGRSDGITIAGCTQLPVSIPLMAFDQATHLFMFRNTDRRRINRMAEFSGSDERTLRELIPSLPRHEFAYVDTRSGLLLRSKVILT